MHAEPAAAVEAAAEAAAAEEAEADEAGEMLAVDDGEVVAEELRLLLLLLLWLLPPPPARLLRGVLARAARAARRRSRSSLTTPSASCSLAATSVLWSTRSAISLASARRCLSMAFVEGLRRPRASCRKVPKDLADGFQNQFEIATKAFRFRRATARTS